METEGKEIIYILFETPDGPPVLASRDKDLLEEWRKKLQSPDVEHIVMPVAIAEEYMQTKDRFFCVAIINYEEQPPSDDESWFHDFWFAVCPRPHEKPFVHIDGEYFECGAFVGSVAEATKLAQEQFEKFSEETGRYEAMGEAQERYIDGGQDYDLR